MPLETPCPSVADRAKDLNDRHLHHSATSVLERALTDPLIGRIALVSSFGAESVVLLHMVSIMDRTTPVIFLDTHMLFQETIDYQIGLTEHLGLTDVRRITPSPSQIARTDPFGKLRAHDADACCALRKSVPLDFALHGFDAWITGRKRFQSDTRAALEFFEPEGKERLKINPLAHWTRENVREYMTENNLPKHPLVAHGYPSIGCAPCTSKVADGEDPRAGRWRDEDKTECGIHFADGKIIRGPISKGKAA